MTPSDLSTRVGQLLVGGFDGLTVDDDFADLVRTGRVGGAILFARNLGKVARDDGTEAWDPEQTAALLGELASLPAPAPLLFSVDQEGGRVQRLRDPFPELPAMRKVGEANRKTLALGAGALLAEMLSAVGFHQDYAPVLDVDSNPDNPIIGDRAFSSDPHQVARLASAFIEGLQSGGVAACGKHFPGHGDTNVDSHLALPRLDHDHERLHAIELVPFVAAARVDVAAIMTAHILFPALDPDHPATLSERVLVPLLRERIGYRGIIVSDDLEMKAIADHYGVEDAAVRAVRAGCDQLLICSKPDWIARAHEALVKAVEGGTLSAARVEEAAGRVEAFKARWVAGRPRPDPSRVASAFPTRKIEALLVDLAHPPAPLADGEELVEYEFEGDPDVSLELET